MVDLDIKKGYQRKKIENLSMEQQVEKESWLQLYTYKDSGRTVESNDDFQIEYHPRWQ